MIKIEHLIKNYGTNCAVDDISFEVEEGEIVGFLGPNGAGKSTTMNILTGYLSSTSGKACIAGIDILKDPIGAKKLIGYLPEQPPLYLDMTVEEYLNFAYDLKSCKLERRAHLEKICETVKYCTLPELEMLLIISEGLVKEYEKVKSSVKSKVFAKEHIWCNQRRYDNSSRFYRDYYGSDCGKLIRAIRDYKRIRGSHRRDELYLADILK
jgi:ABC-type sugar transport system ATPase subunit